MQNPYLFRAKSALISAAIAYLFTAILVFQTIVVANLKGDLIAIAWGIFVCNCVYLLFVRPKIIFYDEAISIINPLTSSTVGWGRVEALDSRYTMSITVSGKKIHAWAAPAPGRYHARTLHASEIKGLKLEGTLRPGDSPRSESGQALYLAKLRMENFQSHQFKSIDQVTKFNRTGLAITIAAPLFAIVVNFLLN
jgi:hypothetical protein